MNFLFIKNLKAMKINIKTSIAWFENQPFERTWSYALNKYYVNTKNIGYMGIVPADMYIVKIIHYPKIEDLKQFLRLFLQLAIILKKI